ncbi:MAG: flagellin, partial [Synergistaceae bacterium]|nr:flagellin [Synergistaceae bacterium]
MRINTNILSLVSYNATMRASSNLAKSIKRLSTGLKINSASDDAAGLAISEKMTAQIKGLDQATRNAQDGISLLATAEGALNEIHSIMQRMRELAVQAANDTLTVQDRGYIKLEIDQLTTQINDIATQTQFNKKRILNGESAVLWSTSTMDIGVLVSGTLLSKDIFGQTKNAEGNYKITLETIQIGSEQVQKSNILYLKHGTQEYDTLINPYSGMSALDALNIVEGVWRIESRSEPFGGITYTGYPPSGSPSTGIDPNIVGAELDAPGNLPAGSYYIRLSDNVPMMATIDEVGVLGVDQSGSPNDRALSDFDAEFTVSHTASTSSTTVVYREDVGATNSGTVNTGGDTNILVNANNDLNIVTQYVVQSTDDKDLVAGNITIDAG